jgi:diaminopimelate decarboxylase
MTSDLWGLTVNGEGHLVHGGCDLVDLARRYGTPLHVVDETSLRHRYRTFLAAFATSHPRTRAFYSYKSNCVPGLLRILHAEGCGAEVISPYELWLAHRLGVPASDIIYNGVNKSAEDLRGAIEGGVGHVNVDSVAEIRRVQSVARALGRPVDVGVRIYPPVGWKAHFGIDPRRDGLVGVCRELKDEGLVNVRGLHVHIGTGLRRSRDHERVTDFICALMRKLLDSAGVRVECLDLGGGFGVPTVKSLRLAEVGLYRVFGIRPRPPRPDDGASPEAFGRSITAALKSSCARHGLAEPELLLEPGRVITSGAQILLLTVRELKRRGSRHIAIADGGMQNHAFPLSYEYHHCRVANRAAGAGPRRRYTVTGPLCSPEDVLYRNWPLPELAEGDVLAVMDAGAYFTSFANNFSFPRPAVVLATAGHSRVIRRRETFDHMTTLDEI